MSIFEWRFYTGFIVYIYEVISLQTKEREVDFDVETAIKVCRQAGYYDHALFLAKEHQLHEWYLKIQLEDIKDYQLTLEYIGKLDFDEVCSIHPTYLIYCV